ncbi:MAG: hypothetical protein M9916_07235 [Crocinitomicaceae bacterium]|nr:hypothetical protein [Crocinitomicaceae bacterium]
MRKEFQLFFVFLLLTIVACQKNEFPKMKTGYYNVKDIEINLNSDSSILTYKALGNYRKVKNRKEYSFNYMENGRTVNVTFDFKKMESKSTKIDFENKIRRYNIKDFKITPTELIVTRREVTDSIISKIHFKYIE